MTPTTMILLPIIALLAGMLAAYRGRLIRSEANCQSAHKRLAELRGAFSHITSCLPAAYATEQPWAQSSEVVSRLCELKSAKDRAQLVLNGEATTAAMFGRNWRLSTPTQKRDAKGHFLAKDAA